MRWLKSFESKVTEDSLKDFCIEHLAYLVDEGFTVRVEDLSDWNEGIVVNIFTVESDNARELTPFTWGTVKDYFIPFFIHLGKKYQIVDGISFITGDMITHNISEYKIINDIKVPILETGTIKYIKFAVENETYKSL